MRSLTLRDGARTPGARAGTAAPITAVPARLGLVLALLAVAYHFSLATLLSAWRYQTPLADVALAPVLAAGLFALAARRHRQVGALRLGRLDYLVAGACLAVVALVLILAPVAVSAYFWAMRLDLLTLPLFAVAAVAAVFGTRALLPFSFPIAFLTLAWPLPYAMLAETALGRLSQGTGAVLVWLMRVVPVATPVAAGSDTRLYVPHGAAGFTVTVASACSGLDSLTGFGVVAAASLYVVRGRVSRRLAWLTSGLALVWVANLARILAILAAGRWLGEGVAMRVLHPVAGLVALNLAFLLLLKVLPWFGLRRRPLGEPGTSDTPLSQPAPASQRATRGALALRGGGLTLVAAALAVANGQLAALATGWDNAGRPAVAPFSAQPAAGPNWTVQPFDRYDWSKVYFGADSTWLRYRLRPAAGSGLGFTMWADAILTPDQGALDAHPVGRCYHFHGFPVLTDQRVTLDDGVIGNRFVYQAPDGSAWHVLTWQWPISAEPGRVEHERMVLLASSGRTLGTPPAPPRRVAPVSSVSTHLVAVLNRFGPDRDANRSLSESMTAAANEMIAARIERTTP